MKKFKYFFEATFKHPLAKHWGALGYACFCIFIISSIMSIFNYIGLFFIEYNTSSIFSLYCSMDAFSTYLYLVLFSYIAGLISYSCAYMIDKE